LVKAFVSPRRALKVLTDFILFMRKDEELQKVVLRPHQMRAVERAQRRARDYEKRSWTGPIPCNALGIIAACCCVLEGITTKSCGNGYGLDPV
jgi:hypothetical protein